MREPQLIGLDRFTNEVVGLKDSSIALIRQQCRAGRIVCPIVGCHAPEITPVRRYERSDGVIVTAHYRHVEQHHGGHSIESQQHFVAKHALARWAELQGYTAVVEATVDGGRRRPDLTIVVGDARWAVEVQFSPIDELQWAQRTGDLEALGYQIWWIWGSDSATYRSCSLTAAMRADLERTCRLWCVAVQLDTLEVQLTSALSTASWRGATLSAWPTSTARLLATHWSPLDKHSISSTGPTSSEATVAVKDSSQRHRRALLEALAAAIAHGSFDRAVTSMRTRLQHGRPGTAPSRAHDRSGSIPGSAWPEITPLAARWGSAAQHQQGSDCEIYVAPEKWKSLILNRLQVKRNHTVFTVDQVVEHLTCFPRTDNTEAVRITVRAFCNYLVDNNHLRRATFGRYATVPSPDAPKLDGV